MNWNGGRELGGKERMRRQEEEEEEEGMMGRSALA